jgi:hypothetical protein
MAEGDKIEVVELELGSSDKNDLWNLQKLCSRHWSCSEVESVNHISVDTALRWTFGRICHSRHWGHSEDLFAYHSTFASWDHASVIDMMTKIIQTSVNLLLKTLLHSVKCFVHLLPICLKVEVEPGLHLLKLSVHRLLNISKVRIKVSNRRLPLWLHGMN